MKLAVSNIAWEHHDDPNVLKILKNNNVLGIEVAPTKVWPNWKGANYKAAKAYKAVMLQKGFKLPAMQSLLFGKPKLQLFDAKSHTDFLDHIKLVAELANGMGCKVLVFGAPKNRRRGQIVYDDAMYIAAEFFLKAAKICFDHNCCIGLEHNPVEYGCDFITNVLDAKELVERVDHSGFKLHLDSAGLHMCGGNITNMILQSGHFRHYHISEPMLKPLFGGIVAHKEAINCLSTIPYEHWISIEMRQVNSMELLDKSLRTIKDILNFGD